jgi:hypothetical protein
LNPGRFSGFSYLLGAPAPSQQSAMGADPTAASRLLGALSQALPPGAQYWPTPLQAGVDPDDNPLIPSGYTYLLQLLAHDMVQTTVPFWAAGPLGLASRNVRSSALVLDTLYGGGPAACPVAYRAAGYSAADRTQLRLGRYQSMKTGIAATPRERPVRDLARINLRVQSDQTNPANFNDTYLTCAADARNDDNLVLAQLVVLFASVHGAIAGRLAGQRPEAVLGYAQFALQRIYHAIIEHDLLPRILHPHTWAVLHDRPADSDRWLWQSDGMPLEFTHGAFRVGHAMVRRRYQFNGGPAGSLTISESIHGGGSRAEMRLPLRETWLIQWSRFFEMGNGVTPNLSRRLSPSQSAMDAAGLMRSDDPAQPENLSLRDSLSAALARTWSVDALIDRIQAQSPDLLPAKWSLGNAKDRRNAVTNWLTKRAKPGVLDNAAISALAADPPLPFFVLLEAALDPGIGGRHLGPLGSAIIGEVVGRSVAHQRQELTPFEPAARAAFEPALWDEMMAIDTMPALVRFAADRCDLAASPVPFV